MTALCRMAQHAMAQHDRDGDKHARWGRGGWVALLAQVRPVEAERGRLAVGPLLLQRKPAVVRIEDQRLLPHRPMALGSRDYDNTTEQAGYPTQSMYTREPAP